MGGLVALATAATPELVSSEVLVDTRLPLPRPLGLPSPTARVRLFATPEDALDRTRLLPAETSAEPALLREVAKSGRVAPDGGWRWKYHTRARQRFTNEVVLRDIARVRCPVWYAYGAERAQTMREVVASSCSCGAPDGRRGDCGVGVELARASVRSAGPTMAPHRPDGCPAGGCVPGPMTGGSDSGGGRLQSAARRTPGVPPGRNEGGVMHRMQCALERDQGMGERFEPLRNEKVRGSNPLSSTNRHPV